jgi:hypothetical protein
MNMLIIKTIALLILSFLAQSCIQEVDAIANKKGEPKVVKVSVVIQDPMIGTKRMHETFKWSDPWKLTKDYELALEEISHGVIDYQVVNIIDARDYFTILKKSGEKLTESRVVELLQETGWKTLRAENTTFDYKAFVEFYGFDKKRDSGEINEVWLWSFPYGGLWESNMMGKDAFWINSEPTENVNCKELLCVMGLNFERDLACALEAYGHRFESVMGKVYGNWDYYNKDNKDRLTNWERYAAYGQKYYKFNAGTAHIGNIHFPPNGVKDYDWDNQSKVKTFADTWANYPNIMDENAREIDCSEWGCTHIGYMKWWFTHIPHYQGISSKDKKLNNWWRYVVDYNEAIRLEKQ